MKYAIPFALLLLGCASVSPVTKGGDSGRGIASALSGNFAPDAGGLPKIYQGPFEYPLESFDRKPAKVYLPLQYESKQGWPLVILLHGFSGTAESQDKYLGLSFRASLRGYVLLVPEGTVMPKGTIGADGKDLGGNQFWNATDTCCDFAKTGVDDTGYLLALIESVKKSYKIDRSRVYLIGHSNGGFMVNRLGCEAGETFAGIANLAGGTYKDPKKCRAPTPIPYLQIHAEDDKTILYQGAPEYAGGKETVEQWRARNGCKDSSVTKGAMRDLVYLIPGRDTDSVTWNKCSSNKEVAFWTIRPFEQQWHSPHVPLFQLRFMDDVLDFLLRQKKD